MIRVLECCFYHCLAIDGVVDLVGAGDDGSSAILWAVEVGQVGEALHERTVRQPVAAGGVDLRRELAAVATVEAVPTLARDTLLDVCRAGAEVALAAVDVRVALANPDAPTARFLAEAADARVRAEVEEFFAQMGQVVYAEELARAALHVRGRVRQPGLWIVRGVQRLFDGEDGPAHRFALLLRKHVFDDNLSHTDNR